MKEIFYLILTKFALRLHNFSYKLASVLAIRAEGGLHPKHRLMNYHGFFIENVNSEDVILDIGCGNGALAYDVAKKAKFVTGIDIDAKKIEAARKKYTAQNIRYLIGDATKYIFDKKFDVIILSNVLEHVDNRIGFLSKIKNISSRFLIRVPMINRDWITLYKKEKEVEWRLDETHYTEYTLEDLRQELSTANMRLQHYSVQFGEIWAIAINNPKER